MSDSDHEDQLSKNLKALRAARGWNQTQTALAAKVAQTAVSRVERGEGRRDAGKVLSRLAQTFGVTLEQLTGAVPLPMEVVMATPDGLQVRSVNYVRPANLPTNAIVSTPEGMKETRVTMQRLAARTSAIDTMEMLLLRKTSEEGYTVADFDAARSVLRETYTMVPDKLPPSRVVEAVLLTARTLRERGLPVSTTSVLAGLAYSLLEGAATESSETAAAPPQP